MNETPYDSGTEQSVETMLVQLIQMVAKNNELVTDMRADFVTFRDEMNSFRDEMVAFRDEMYSFRDEMISFRGKMYAFRDDTIQRFDRIDRRLEVHRNLLGRHTEEIELLKQHIDQPL